MNTRHVWMIAGLVALLPLTAGCDDGLAVTVDYVAVSLSNAETYTYPTVSGDEEGAGISVQAKHFSISEMRRNATTNWVATYIYQPAAEFVGTDRAEIEVFTGSDGASPSTHMRRVIFIFEVHN